MKPDGVGTDERLAPTEKRRSSASVERDVMRLALIFTLIASLILGGYYYSKRAKMPDLSSDNPALQTP
jgi:predicted secreted protein